MPEARYAHLVGDAEIISGTLSLDGAGFPEPEGIGRGPPIRGEGGRLRVREAVFAEHGAERVADLAERDGDLDGFDH